MFTSSSTCGTGTEAFFHLWSVCRRYPRVLFVGVGEYDRPRVPTLGRDNLIPKILSHPPPPRGGFWHFSFPCALIYPCSVTPLTNAVWRVEARALARSPSPPQANHRHHATSPPSSLPRRYRQPRRPTSRKDSAAISIMARPPSQEWRGCSPAPAVDARNAQLASVAPCRAPQFPAQPHNHSDCRCSSPHTSS